MTKAEATTAAAAKLTELLGNSQQQHQATLLLVSGGSALELLDQVEFRVLGDYLTVGVLDERFSQDPGINNFSQLMATHLFAAAVQAGASTIDTRIQTGEAIKQLAARFEAALKNWRTTYPDGKILITQGMGPDRHTAGIMPFPENPHLFYQLFEQPDKWVVDYDAGSKNQYPLRVTTTITFLRKVDESIFFAFGDDKKTALEKIETENGSFADTPARIVREVTRMWSFSDRVLHISYTN